MCYGLWSMIKVICPIIYLCWLWRKVSCKRDDGVAIIHELSELGLSSIIYHHDTKITDQDIYDTALHLHNTYKWLRDLE